MTEVSNSQIKRVDLSRQTKCLVCGTQHESDACPRCLAYCESALRRIDQMDEAELEALGKRSLRVAAVPFGWQFAIFTAVMQRLVPGCQVTAQMFAAAQVMEEQERASQQGEPPRFGLPVPPAPVPAAAVPEAIAVETTPGTQAYRSGQMMQRQ